MKRFILGVLLAVAGAGCEQEPAADQVVPIEQVPANVLAIAKKELPGLQIDTVYRMIGDGKDAYEVRFKDRRGKTREVEVSATGEVLAIE